MPEPRKSVHFEAGKPGRFEIGKDSESYPTTIEAVGESYILALAPLKGETYVPVPTNSDIVLVVERRSNPYFFDVRVLDTVSQEGKTFLKVTRPPDTAGRQLRQVVRIPVLLEAQIWAVDEDGKTTGTPLKGTFLDISQGGALVMIRERLEVGDDVFLRVQLGKGGERIAVAGTIRRVNATTANNLPTFRYGIQFKGLEKDRRLSDTIAKYVIQREREIIRQGTVGR